LVDHLPFLIEAASSSVEAFSRGLRQNSWVEKTALKGQE
jgi:hypothetical protein